MIGCVGVTAQVDKTATSAPKVDSRIYQTPPFRADYMRILRSKYILHEHDCSNKAAEYVTILREYGGLDADIIIIDDDLTDRITHAIVRIRYGIYKTLYVDPTQGWYGSSLRDWIYIGEIPYEIMYSSIWFKRLNERGEFDFKGMEKYHKTGE
jgi:hypothetical protein